MTTYPQCAATEEDGPTCAPILSNHILPARQTRLRESGRRMSTIQKISRETSGFHMEAARRHGVNTHRGLAHFKAAKAYKEADSKLMQYFEGGDPGQDSGQQLDPKAQLQAHQEAVGFHKKMAEKHGLDSPQGSAHIHLMEKHMDSIRGLKQQPAAQGPGGRQQPQMQIPKKSEQPNRDVHQDKPPLIMKQKASAEAEEGGPGSGPKKAGSVAAKNSKGEPTHIWTKKIIGGKPRMIKQPLDVEGGRFAQKMHDKGYSQGTF